MLCQLGQRSLEKSALYFNNPRGTEIFLSLAEKLQKTIEHLDIAKKPLQIYSMATSTAGTSPQALNEDMAQALSFEAVSCFCHDLTLEGEITSQLNLFYQTLCHFCDYLYRKHQPSPSLPNNHHFFATLEECRQLAKSLEQQPLETKQFKQLDTNRIRLFNKHQALQLRTADLINQFLDIKITTDDQMPATVSPENDLAHWLIVKGYHPKEARESSEQWRQYLRLNSKAANDILPAELIKTLKNINQQVLSEYQRNFELQASAKTKSLNTKNLALSQTLMAFFKSVLPSIAIIVCLTLTGCGFKTAPISEHPSLRPSIPWKTPQKSPDNNAKST
jgi:hypothetical protein